MPIPAMPPIPPMAAMRCAIMACCCCIIICIIIGLFIMGFIMGFISPADGAAPPAYGTRVDAAEGNAGLRATSGAVAGMRLVRFNAVFVGRTRRETRK